MRRSARLPVTAVPVMAAGQLATTLPLAVARVRRAAVSHAWLRARLGFAMPASGSGTAKPVADSGP